MTEEILNYINGEWVESETGDTIAVENPSDTSDIVARCQQSNRVDAQDAVHAANQATDEWGATPGPQRGSYLRQVGETLESQQDELTELLSREEGKTLREAGGEVQRAINIYYYYAEQARDFGGDVKPASGGDTHLYSKKVPLGVAALITPWNYPIAIPSWKIAPAIAAGNTVVFKPATQTPTIAKRIVEAFDEVDIPDGVINFVTGPGSEVGDTFITHDDVDAVSFTGSAEVGNMVYDQATEDQKRVQCEMGGKNPTIVMPSADMEDAVKTVGYGAFGLTGQACTATSRALVHEDIYDEFLEAIIDFAEDLDVGPSLDGSHMGPHSSEGELEGTLKYVELGEEEGATLETGGEKLQDGEYENGHFVSPAVFTDVDPDMRIAQEEIFGPVLCMIEISDYEEAVEIANDVKYGLSASILTNDLREANRFKEDIEAGVVKINQQTTGVELHVPFGGFKQSSTNTYREQGEAGLEFFTSTKTVYESY
ncbi:MAG: aldehyde dehydrogenase family protein [Halobacteriaceae archaeon]